MAQPGALANIDATALLGRLAKGEFLKTLAEEYGVHKVSLRAQLIKHPDYAAAIAEQTEALIDSATQEIMGELPLDPAYIARARVRLDAAHKWAARRDQLAAQQPIGEGPITIEESDLDLARRIAWALTIGSRAAQGMQALTDQRGAMQQNEGAQGNNSNETAEVIDQQEETGK